MKSTYKLISIVIPVFNEEKYVEELITRVVKADTLGLKKEFIVVNDGSTDDTLKILEKVKIKLQRKNIIFRLINKENEGKGSALKLGFEKTEGDIVLVQDADLEYNPNDYALLMNPFIKGDADVVYGSRLATSGPHRVLYFWHYVINKSLTTLSNIFTNLNLTDMETGYKVFKGDLIRKIAPKLKSKRFGFEPEITSKMAKIKGIKIYEVGISYSGRTYDEGKKINWKDGARAIWEVFYFNIFQEFNIKIFEEELLEPVARFFRFNKSMRFLPKKKQLILADLGSGPKIRFYFYSIKKGIDYKSYLGIDPLMSRSIRDKYRDNNRVKLIDDPLKKKIPLRDNSVDCITGFAFLEHVDNPKDLVLDSIRVMKKDGVAIFTTPSKRSKKILEFLSYKLNLISKREVKEHKNYFDKKSLESILSGSKKGIKIHHEYFELGLNNLFVITKN